jgi:hypothetical protein
MMYIAGDKVFIPGFFFLTLKRNLHFSRNKWKMDIFSSFLINLAQRQRNENALSDVTWAMCQASPTFLTEWVRFFFKDMDISAIQNIDREVYADEDKGSRVDFYIETADDPMPYIIEVKIYDTKDHFGQYDPAFHVDPSHFGHITNYPFKKEGYPIVRQWEQFYETIKKSHFPEGERSLKEAYLNYLKSVCNMQEIERISDIEKMSSLYDLTRLFKQLVPRETDLYTAKWYKDYTSDASKYTALQVNYTTHPEWKNIFPVIGVWFDPPGPRICAGFYRDGGWGMPVVKHLYSKHALCNSISTVYCRVTKIEPKEVFFCLSDNALRRFLEAPTVDGQRAILAEFLDEVISFPTRID